MKLPTSSSIFLATLAISSSSSSMAAPAQEVHQNGLSSSPSDRNMDYHDGFPGSGHHPFDAENKFDTSASKSHSPRQLGPDVGEVVKDLTNVIPAVRQILGGLLTVKGGAQSPDDKGSESIENASPENVEALQAAIREVSRMLNGTLSGAPVPAPLKGVAGDTPVGSIVGSVPVAQNVGDDDPNSSQSQSLSAISTSASDAPPLATAANDNVAPSSSPSPSATDTYMSDSATATSANGNTDAASSSYASGTASAAPSSPTMPGNPPNTPSLPINPPSLPVNP